jgi:hypothetical protein
MKAQSNAADWAPDLLCRIAKVLLCHIIRAKYFIRISKGCNFDEKMS